jgi:Family of unknown function (DUF5681)
MPRKRYPHSSNPEASYEVGYGKPPRGTQFKPGQSGNPRGRPHGQRNLSTLLKEALNEKVTLREGDRTRKVPKALAILLRILNSALQGEPKATAAYLQFIRCEGLLREELEGKSPGQLEIDDRRIIAEYLVRQGIRLDEAVAAENDAPSKSENSQSEEE